MNPEINRILFTSDLSENSKHAFKYALKIAGQFHASLVFLYVMEDLPDTAKAFINEEVLLKIREQTKDVAKNALIGKRQELNALESELARFCQNASDEAEKSGEKSVESEVIIAEGNTAETIISTADEMDCDAIVLGGCRRGVIAEAMLGNVVKGVLRRSKKLVIVAPPIK